MALVLHSERWWDWWLPEDYKKGIILVFFETLNIFRNLFFNFLLCTTFRSLCPIEKINVRNLKPSDRQPSTIRCTSMFPIIFCYQLMEYPLRHQFLNYFSQKINLCLITFFPWMVFLSELKRYIHFAGVFSNIEALITTKIMNLILGLIFAAQRQVIFVSLRKSHPSVWFSNLLLKTLF